MPKINSEVLIVKKTFGFLCAMALVFSITTAASADIGERPAPPIHDRTTVGTFDIGERP